MSEIHVSPGVYVSERDFSYYVSSVGNSALAIVGETKSGPAFLPTLITNMSEYEEIFGLRDTNMPLGYAVKSYLKYSNRAYVVRVLGADSLRGSFSIASVSGVSSSKVLATFLVSGTSTVTITGSTATTAADELVYMQAPGYSGNVSFTDTASPVYVETLFPRNATVTGTQMALQHLFSNACVGETISTGSCVVSTIAAGSPLEVSGYSNAKTPLIVGDVADGSSEASGLFTIYTISDGKEANKQIKIAIENVDTTNKTFDITVRKYSDTNASPIVYEKFTNLSMNPTSPNYILKAIGDSRDNSGNYTLISKYIYVQVESNAPTTAVPLGYNRIVSPISGGTAFPEFEMTTSYTSTTSLSRQILGLDYSTTEADLLMYGHSSMWDLDGSSDNHIKGFHLNSGASASYYQVGPSGSTSYTSKSYAKFLIPVLGGNDGWAQNETVRTLLSATPTTSQYTQWKAGLDAISNTEEYDINLLAVPGVKINSTIGTYAIEIAETRADCLYIGDMPSNVSTSTAAAAVTSSIDSNYACTYWPYVVIYDDTNEQNVTIPPTPQVLEAMAYTDSVSYPWFAVAGMNRGLLTDVIKAQYKLKISERNELDVANINPIATFAGSGIAIWGQNTLQSRNTALDKINVRRVMIYIEKIIAGASKYLVFEQNDETSWNMFKAMVQPILDTVRIKRGLYDFRVIMDETTNTPDVIDRNQMVGKIYVKPTKTAEEIIIYFNILNTGAQFDEN